MRIALLGNAIVMLVVTSVLCFVAVKIFYGKVTIGNYVGMLLLSLAIGSIVRCITFLLIGK